MYPKPRQTPGPYIQQSQHPQDDIVTHPNTTCLTIHHPATTKGAPPQQLKGWPPHQQSLLFLLLIRSSKNSLQTDGFMRARFSLLTPSISITTSNMVTATTRNLINSNSAAIQNTFRDTPPHPPSSPHQSHQPSMESPSPSNTSLTVHRPPTYANNRPPQDCLSHGATKLLPMLSSSTILLAQVGLSGMTSYIRWPPIGISSSILTPWYDNVG